MAEVYPNFTKKGKKFYSQGEVDEYVRQVEAELNDKDNKLDALQKQVVELQGRIGSLTKDDASVEEKVELYDKLMKKMGDDYQNLLAPAIAKAKVIEEEAEKEYNIRIDQAKCSAEGIYDRAVDKIAATVDENMERIYGLMGDFIYSKTLAGRIGTAIKGCRVVTKKVAMGIVKVAGAPKKVVSKVSDAVKDRSNRFNAAVQAYQQKKESVQEEDLECPEEKVENCVAEVVETEEA